MPEFYRELAKFALGALRWPPSEAMAADVNLILIAGEGHGDDLYQLQRIFYGAQGVKLPAKRPDSRGPQQRMSGKQFLAWARGYNERRKRAGQKAASSDIVTPD